MNGFSLVNEILNKYEGQDEQQDKIIDNLRASIFLFINTFNNKWKSDFQTAKHLLITLSKIIKAEETNDLFLTPDEKKEFKILSSMFDNPDFLSAVKQIYLIINNNELYRGTIIQMQRVFSGECIGIMATYEVSINKRLSFLQQNQQNTEQKSEFENLEKKKGEAEIISENERRIRSRYRV